MLIETLILTEFLCSSILNTQLDGLIIIVG